MKTFEKERRTQLFEDNQLFPCTDMQMIIHPSYQIKQLQRHATNIHMNTNRIFFFSINTREAGRDEQKKTCTNDKSYGYEYQGRLDYLLGTPLTNFNGRITRNARNDLTSKPWILY